MTYRISTIEKTTWEVEAGDRLEALQALERWCGSATERWSTVTTTDGEAAWNDELGINLRQLNYNARVLW